ncbi:MAG: hypothetical protein GX275_09485 [Clostridiales bacterium]|nr:hypothetical protein [Clostridiales bacterium]
MNCFLDYRVSEEEINNIINIGLKPIIIPKSNNVYEAINGHVDIQLSIPNKNKKEVIVHKDIPEYFLEELSKNNIKYILSKDNLGYKYPNNIILNGLILDNYFIHNIKFTDRVLLQSQKDKKIINVKQGYTKCSVLPIKDNVIVTSDTSIYKKLIKENFDILLLPPGDIILPTLNYGFIGGVGGMISSNKLALFGELSHYQYGNELAKFLYKHEIETVSLKKGKLFDRGSLLCI